MARKDEMIGLRIPSAVKAALREVARKEGRSLAQVCDLFLRAGLYAYEKQGSKYIQSAVPRGSEKKP